MNRRSFLRNSALALFGFTVLPPADTYQRVWRATREIMPWDQGPYRCLLNRPMAHYFSKGYLKEMSRLLAQYPNFIEIENFSG